MKATELLVNQHREFEQLFEQLHNVEEGDEKVVREELARNLIGHMAIEEEIFYPAMLEAMPERIALAEIEHATARYALAQFLATPPGDRMFRARANALDAMIRNHVNMEEKEILPRAENVLGTEPLQQLSRRMEARFEQVVSEDFMGMLKQKLMQELPAMLVPRAVARTATKKRAVRATTKKATPAKRAATAKRGAATKRTAPTKRAATTKRTTGMKRSAPAPRQTGGAGRPTSKRGGGARKRAS